MQTLSKKKTWEKTVTNNITYTEQQFFQGIKIKFTKYCAQLKFNLTQISKISQVTTPALSTMKYS